MLLGLEDNTRIPNRELAKGNYKLVEWAVRTAEVLNRSPATRDESREMIELTKR